MKRLLQERLDMPRGDIAKLAEQGLADQEHLARLAQDFRNLNRKETLDELLSRTFDAAQVEHAERAKAVEGKSASPDQPAIVRKADLGRRERTKTAQERAKRALKACYGNLIPEQGLVPNEELTKRVNDWLANQKPKLRDVSKDSILRAAGRRK
jgi:dissimilatory sulfite reductase (desulfoviridin) alpha/beta subunit